MYTHPRRTKSCDKTRYLCLAVLLLYAIADRARGAAPADAPPPAAREPAVSKEAMADALARAAALTPQKVKEFREALQSVAGGFQQVEVGTTPGQAKWNVNTLNTLGKGVDAVRFRTPAEDSLNDLGWVLAFPRGSVKVWYITPVVGDMKGFKNFEKLTPSDLKGHDVPADSTVIAQKLAKSSLKPDTEYLLWFTLADEKPVEIHAAINFTKPTTSKTKEDVLRSLGMK